MSTTVSFNSLDNKIPGLGIALAVVTVLVGAMLQKTRRLRGVKSYLKSQFNACKNNDKIAILLTILYYLVLLVPFIMLLIWLILMGSATGVNPTIPVLFTCLFIFALLVPTDENIFYYKVGVLIILYLIAQILTMTLSWVPSGSGFFSLTAVLLVTNGIFVSIALWLVDGSCWNIPSAISLQFKTKIRSRISIWKVDEQPPSIITGGLYYYICSRPTVRIIAIVILYIVGLLTLLTYALVVYYHTTFLFLGVINSVCLIATDLVIFNLIYITKDNDSNPIFNSCAGIIVRVCLIAFAGQYWFLGYCILYLMLFTYVAFLIINKHYPSFQKIPNTSPHKTNLFKLPQLAGLILLGLFGGLIFYLGNEDGTNLSVVSATLGQTTYPFWAIGVACIILSFAWIFYLTTLRIIQRSSRKIRSTNLYYLGIEGCSEYYFFLFFSYAFLVILGIYLHSKVNNHIIWASCVFLPLCYQAFVIFLINWVQNDYLIFGDVAVYNKKLKKRRLAADKIQKNKQSLIKNLKEKAQQIKGQNQQTMINLIAVGEVQSNFVVNRDNKSEYEDWKQQYGFVEALREDLMLPTDKKILLSIPMMIIPLIAYSIAFYFIQYQHTAFNVTFEIVFLFLTLTPMVRYFNTLQRPNILQIILFSLGVILNYVYGPLCLVFEWNNSVVWTLWWAIINPFILSVIANYSLLRDKGICLASIIVSIVSIILSFGVGIILLVAFSLIPQGITLLGVALYYGYINALYYLYLHNNKSLPWFIIPISIIIVIATCFAIMIYAFIVESFDDFFGFSITYLVINLLILGLGIYLLFNDIRNRFDRPNFYSPYGSPIYKYDPEIRSAKKNSRALITWLAAWFMYYCYTVLMKIFIADVHVGVSASQIFAIAAFLTFIYFTTYNSYKGGKISKQITHQLMEKAWDEVVKNYDQSFGELPKMKDLQQTLDKYKQMEADGSQKISPQKQNKQNENNKMNINVGTDIQLAIHDMQEKLSKAIDNERIQLINFWIAIIFKVQSIRKKRMLRFTTFIRQSEDFLASIGVSIILANDLYDLQSIYNQAQLQYNSISPLQKLQFDKNFKDWKQNKKNNQDINEQLNNKHLQAEKKRDEQLRKKLLQKNIDDSDQPIQKMRDSPLKLKKIANEYQSKTYEDNGFRASSQNLPPNAKSQCKGWSRSAPGCKLINGGHSSMSVRQGYIGDCYLISAIGVLSRAALQNILGIGVWENPNGAFMVKFKKWGRDIHIIIDNQFPIDSANNWLFGRCQDKTQIFTNILQKAYAKLYGGYQNIVGGKVSIALAQMTGGFPQQIRLKQYQDKNINELFQKMVEFIKAGYLMGAGSPENSQGDAVNIDGIVQGHAYLIIDVRNLDGNKLVKLRNPHGNQGLQSQLDWSDDSPKWNKRLLNLLGQQLKQDGAFWMSIDDFVYVYRSLYVCRIFDPNIWKLVGPILGEWKGQSAGGLPTKKNPGAKLGKNPHYGIKVSKKSTIFIQLQQNEKDESRRGKNYIFFMIQQNDGKRTHSFSMNQLVGKSGSPINSTSVSAQINLNAPSYPYTFSLMVSCIEQGNEGSYNLSIYSDDQSMELIDDKQFDR